MKSHGMIAKVIFCITVSFTGQSIGATYISCDGCSLTQMNNAAISNGAGRVLVGDVLDNNMQAFRVYRTPQPRTIGPVTSARNSLYADLDSISPQEASAFTAYVQFYNSAPIGYKKYYNLRIVKPGEPVGVPNVHTGTTLDDLIHSGLKPPYSPMAVPKPGGGTVSYPTAETNVYNVINSGPKQNTFLSWVGNLSVFGINDLITNEIAVVSVFHITSANHVPGLSFTVAFTDGSHVGVYLDTTQAPAQILVNEDSGVDSHGNNVPATPEAVAGSGRQMYDFAKSGNPTDRANMYQQITALGSHVSAGARVYACVRVMGQAEADCAWIQ